jgi:carboxyl-terminal processing protease
LGHYSPATIDAFSKGVYKDYVQALDPSKRFFLQSDIDEFSKFETELDDQLINKDLIFSILSYELMKRMEESKTYKGIMNVPLTIQSMRVLTPIMIKRLMQNTAELTERWRKQIKLSALSSLTERLKVQEKN